MSDLPSPLAGARKDRQSLTADWLQANQPLIAGVSLKEVRHVPKSNGYLTEIWRRDWLLDELAVDQVFQVTLQVGAISAWHTHGHTTDRLFANDGLVRIVLYDARPSSATHGLINEFRLGTIRPGLLVVPPLVWHGVQNLSETPSRLLNLVDQAYRYADPDHWRLPPDTDQIPYRFGPSKSLG